jgi:hypothetical protein
MGARQTVSMGWWEYGSEETKKERQNTVLHRNVQTTTNERKVANMTGTKGDISLMKVTQKKKESKK